MKQGDVLFSLAMKEQATKYKKGTKLPDFQVLSLSQTKSSQVCNSQWLKVFLKFLSLRIIRYSHEA